MRDFNSKCPEYVNEKPIYDMHNLIKYKLQLHLQMKDIHNSSFAYQINNERR